MDKRKIPYPEYILDEETRYNYNLKRFLSDHRVIIELVRVDRRLQSLKRKPPPALQKRKIERPNVYQLYGGDTEPEESESERLERVEWERNEKRLERLYDIIAKHTRRKYKDEDEVFDYWHIFIAINIFIERNFEELLRKGFLRQEINRLLISKNLLIHLLMRVKPLTAGVTDGLSIDNYNPALMPKDYYYEYGLLNIAR